MKERRVVVTGAGGVTAFGNSWDEIKPRLQLCRNAVRRMTDWDVYKGLNARIAAPVEDFTLPDTYTRKKTRSMGRVSKLAVRSSEFALESAGLINDPVLSSGRMGVAFGSCCGSLDGVMEFGGMLLQHDTNFVNGTTYVRMMPHTAAVNVSLFFGITGRVIPTSSACTSGSQAIGYAAEAIRYGQADLMIAGGAEELSPADTAAFDALFAASTKNETPELTPSPFDKDRDGLVIGEGGAALVLEEYEHAKARGATILGEVAGFATNCDATHITSPNRITMEACLRWRSSQPECRVRNRLRQRTRYGYCTGGRSGKLRDRRGLWKPRSGVDAEELFRPHAGGLRSDGSLALPYDDAGWMVLADSESGAPGSGLRGA